MARMMSAMDALPGAQAIPTATPPAAFGGSGGAETDGGDGGRGSGSQTQPNTERAVSLG